MGVNHRLRGPPSTSGAASAPAVSMNTKVAPDAMPGLACGMTMNRWICHHGAPRSRAARSEEHTSELQSLMRISYAVFCLKNKTNNNKPTEDTRKTHRYTTQTKSLTINLSSIEP